MQARTETLTPGGNLIFNSGEALIAAASSGLGLAQVAEYYAPEIEAGRLVEVMRGYRAYAHDISIIFQQRRRIAPRLRVFVDFLSTCSIRPLGVKDAKGWRGSEIRNPE